MSSDGRLYKGCFRADDVRVNEVIESVAEPEAQKRIHRSAEEKRRIVEATFAPGTSIARVAREHGVNSNQVFQCGAMSIARGLLAVVRSLLRSCCLLL